MTKSAVAASGEAASLTRATVCTPWRRASSSTATMSGERPDCDIPMTSASRMSGFAPYRVSVDGAASDTASELRTANRYCPYSAALSDVPRAAITANRGRRTATAAAIPAYAAGALVSSRASACGCL